MFKRLNLNGLPLLFLAFAFMFLFACGGTKGGSSTSSYTSGGNGSDSVEEAPPPKANELKEARDNAVSLTEENHDLSKEIFDLKNKLGVSD